MQLLDNPLTVLKKEVDQIRSVVTTIADKIAETNENATQLAMQRATLLLVAEAIEMKMDSLRANGSVQLELDLGD